MKSVCLIVNPNAGRKTGLVAARAVAGLLGRGGVECEELVSPAPGGTRAIAAALDPLAYDAILAVGGDGTLFEVVNGLLEHRDSVPVPLGLIPVGTGNSFVRDLGISSVEDAVAPVLAGTTRAVDVGRFAADAGGFYFANLLGAGFVSNVAHRARRYKAFGSMSYVFAVVEEVMRLRSTPVVLEIDGAVIEREALFVEICNSRYTGGSMMMAPGALIDDGLLDVVVASRMNRRTVLALLPSIFAGRHVDSPLVEVFRGRSIRLTSARPMALTPDGEFLGSTPLEASVRERALEMFCR